MTFDGGKVESEIRMGTGEEYGAYVKLGEAGADEVLLASSGAGKGRRRRRFWWWMRTALLSACLGVLAGVIAKWVGPLFMDKVVIPIINWLTSTFSAKQLAVILFASVALFPTFLLPSSPSMWVAGLTFGYGFGFLLIIVASVIGVSLPFMIGSLFHHKIQLWYEKYPKQAAIIKSAGEGGWFDQFRAVALIRISPFPYILYNYCAVATNVDYVPYITGSLVGVVPDIFVSIYTGNLLRTLADASRDSQFLSPAQIVLNVTGFCFTAASTTVITIYAKKKLSALAPDDDDLPLLK
uniref:VTT domain-containing protein n=1 Tax=Kalanchoe fedtschenkoi TaxID=63787 RepID=A0A7N0U161_KALFE